MALASEVDICNAALAHLGDSAQVASINPPDSTAQSRWCSRFYPIARDALLERHNWGFTLRRATLLRLDADTTAWRYAYSPPPGVLNYLAVTDATATDDLAVPMVGLSIPQQSVYAPQPFVVEALDTGQPVLYTNQLNAVLRYTVKVTDTSQYNPLFVVALELFLASYLAGPLIKGTEGRQVGAQMRAEAKTALMEAAASDANQGRVQPVPAVPWIAGR